MNERGERAKRKKKNRKKGQKLMKGARGGRKRGGTCMVMRGRNSLGEGKKGKEEERKGGKKSVQRRVRMESVTLFFVTLFLYILVLESLTKKGDAGCRGGGGGKSGPSR